jgi:hypothetical protein
MAAGDKPRIKVALKEKGEGTKNVSILAAWDRDGKLSASLDKRVVELAVKFEDGTITRVKRNAEGKTTHFVNVFDEGLNGQAPAARPAPTPASSAFDGDGFGAADDIPFDRLRGEVL